MAEIEKSFVRQYAAAFQFAAAQKRSILADTVRNETQRGEAAFWDVLGNIEAEEVSTRHARTPIFDVEQDRRRTDLRKFHTATLIDEYDKLMMLIDPTSAYIQRFIQVLNRKVDILTIAAARGLAKYGKEGGNTVALPSTQKVAVGTTNLTKAKILDAKEMLDAADVDEEIPRYLIIAASQLAALLGVMEYTSRDYRDLLPLLTGKAVPFAGFEIRLCNRLPKVGNDRFCLAYAKDGILLANGDGNYAPETHADRSTEYSYSWQPYAAIYRDAVRMEEVKVVEIACDETK